jgi:uncharacterized RDD family membrane protein YckC
MDPRHEQTTAPGLFRRLAAITYDALLLGGLLLIAGAPLPLVPESVQKLWWVRPIIQGYLLACCFLFFGWFWVHGGQTLGMRAWRIRVVQDDGQNVCWARAAIRFLGAILSWAALGVGFVWVIIDPAGRAWHDRLSKTRLMLLPKAPGKRA